MSQEQYKKGREDGQWLTWYDEGPLNTEVNYKNGLLNGTYKVLTIKGEVVFEATYKDDKLVKTKIDNRGKVK